MVGTGHVHLTALPLLYRLGFSDKSNQEVVSEIIKEVKSHLPGVSSVSIKG